MHRHTAGSRASAKSIHRRTRSLRPPASLLSTFPAPAGVAPKTSRSIKPQERDLRDLRLFVLVRFFTRPTNHPRHAACASNYESKPVRPRVCQSIYRVINVSASVQSGTESRENPCKFEGASRFSREARGMRACQNDARAERLYELRRRAGFQLRFLLRRLAALQRFISQILARLPVQNLSHR